MDPRETRAGAKDLAGFIEAPEMKAKKKISSPTMSLEPHNALTMRIHNLRKWEAWHQWAWM
jgi:hypothetical protein